MGFRIGNDSGFSIARQCGLSRFDAGGQSFPERIGTAHRTWKFARHFGGAADSCIVPEMLTIKCSFSAIQCNIVNGIRPLTAAHGYRLQVLIESIPNQNIQLNTVGGTLHTETLWDLLTNHVIIIKRNPDWWNIFGPMAVVSCLNFTLTLWCGSDWLIDCLHRLRRSCVGWYRMTCR